MSLQDFKGMSRERFLGEPTISPTSAVALTRVPNCGAQIAFLAGKYTASYGPAGGNVFDKGKLIACYRREVALAVHPNYQGCGIAKELVYQVAIFTGKPLARNAKRSTAGQNIFAAVWKRIQTELASA